GARRQENTYYPSQRNPGPRDSTGGHRAVTGQNRNLSKRPEKIKVAPDLAEMLEQDDEDNAAELRGRSLAEVRREWLQRLASRARKGGAGRDEDSTARRVNGATLPSLAVPPEERQSFILQTDPAMPALRVSERVRALGGRVSGRFESAGLMAVEMPRTAIRQLAAESAVSYISPDRPVMAMGHLEVTTGAAQIRSLISNTTLDGKGIGIAVLDSGVDDRNQLIKATCLAYSQDYTGLGVTTDPYGHGTHVTSMAIGTADVVAGAYKGIAPAARILNLRVLDGTGAGSASGIINAINWCITNKTAQKIHIINLSLGTLAKDSYLKDPLCLAARRAHDAGIVVVAAAGNDGKDINGGRIYGGIHSPGIDPSVITVGAVNTYGTDARSDDTVATYSSRGPTRGFTVDAWGVRHYDNLIKPDLVAPGNKIMGAEAARNALVTAHPQLDFAGLSDSKKDLMTLNGTSMAAPIVSGAVALMLQKNPALTPGLVKAILQYTAQRLPGASVLDQGAGELNAEGALRLTAAIPATLPTAVGASLVGTMPAQQSTISGQTFNWFKGIYGAYNHVFGGSALFTKYHRLYDKGFCWVGNEVSVNGLILADGLIL